jgi:hypothetical protein
MLRIDGSRSDPSEYLTPIAFCGTRGLPANYGGFETAVDEISRRFTEHGYHCEVFCRNSNREDRPLTHEGRTLIYVDGSTSRTLDTFVSAIQTGLYLWKNRKRYSHVFWFNNANFPGIIMTRLAGLPMSVNTDGLEWRRAKWSWPFKVYYILSSFCIARLCRTLISDSDAIQAYYRTHFLKRTHMIPYGTPRPVAVSPDRAARILEKFGLEKGKYFLQITRFEPDNLPYETALAFLQSGLVNKGFKDVVVGFRDPTPYAQKLKSLDGSGGVAVLNAIYDPAVLHVLRHNCFCYVHGNSVGGTNPALLEAMACCPRIMSIDCTFSREVLGELGLYFNPANIVPTFRSAYGSPNQQVRLVASVESRYQWDAVADAYLRLAHGQSADYSPATLAKDQSVAVPVA